MKACESCGEPYINGVCGNCGDIQNTDSNYQIGDSEKQDLKPLEKRK